MNRSGSLSSSRRFSTFAIVYLLWPPFAFAVAERVKRVGAGRANPFVVYLFLAAALLLVFFAFREAQARVWLAVPSLAIAAFANAFVLTLRLWAAHRLFDSSSLEVPKK